MEAYLNGKLLAPVQLKDFIKDMNYIIIVGKRNIGKTVYAKSMSKYDLGVIYLVEQQLETLPRKFRENAIYIIEIRRIKNVE